MEHRGEFTLAELNGAKRAHYTVEPVCQVTKAFQKPTKIKKEKKKKIVVLGITPRGLRHHTLGLITSNKPQKKDQKL